MFASALRTGARICARGSEENSECCDWLAALGLNPVVFPLFFQIYACMMVFFLSNMIENQLMSTGAFEITFNGK